MNCKRGDLAIVVKSWAGNEGKIVNCIRLATQDECDFFLLDPEDKPYWIIDVELISTIGVPANLVADMQIRPIRPSEGQDETLSWKDVPQACHDPTLPALRNRGHASGASQPG